MGKCLFSAIAQMNDVHVTSALGEGTTAVHSGLHYGTSGAPRARHFRTIPPSGDLGQPIAFQLDKLTDSLLPRSPNSTTQHSVELFLFSSFSSCCTLSWIHALSMYGVYALLLQFMCV